MSSPVPDRAISAAVEPWRIDRDQWKVRAEAAEAALEATKTERDKIGQRLRDRTGEWKLALHQRDEERARAEAAEARTVQLEAALRGVLALKAASDLFSQADQTGDTT